MVDLLGQVADARRDVKEETSEDAPPRSIGVAFALAVFSQPHMFSTMPWDDRSSTEDIRQTKPRQPDRPLNVPTDLLAEATGLPQWELDELREDIDRRAGNQLVLSRVHTWLVNHFDIPNARTEQMFNVLFPGAAGQVGTVGIARRGAQLYALVDQDSPPPYPSVYLPWLVADDESSYTPTGAFKGRYVDIGLRRQLGNSLGAGPDAMAELLDNIITIVPRRNASRFIAHDHWRAAGFEALTGLAGPYPSAGALTDPLLPDEVETSRWMGNKGGKLVFREAAGVFDILAVRRVRHMLRQLYAHILGGLLTEPEPLDPDAGWVPPTTADLLVIDTCMHVSRTLQPLLDWAAADATVKHLASVYGVDEDEAAVVLGKINAIWKAQAERQWTSPPTRAVPRSIAVGVADHLLRTQDALRVLFHKRAESKQSHRELLLLFAGHYFSESPVQRLWEDERVDGAGGLDPVGKWFWATWTRLLEMMRSEMSGTFSMPNVAR
jgi:hypothetical protein